MAVFKLCLFLAVVGACFAGEFTKCEPNEMHVKVTRECIKSETNKDAATLSDMVKLHKEATEEEVEKVVDCTMKAKGIINENDEYVEEKAIECVEGIKASDEIIEKLKEGVIACGKGLDTKSKEDHKKIFKCTKEMLHEHCD